MTKEFYFFEQNSHVSRFGGVQRTKKTSKEYNQALQYSKFIFSKNNPNELQDSLTLPNASTQTVLPEILTKDLDSILQIYAHQPSINSPTSNRSRSPQFDAETIEDEHDFSHCQSILPPKVSLPASLIVQLHSTWSDLIQNTNYQYKVFSFLFV